MATANPFDLLGDDDNDDVSQLIAAQQQKLSVKKPAISVPPVNAPSAKLPSKPLPPAQAVRESRNNNTTPARGGTGRGGPGRGGSGRGTGFVQNRFLGSRSTNGYSAGVPPEDGDTGKSSERDQESYGSPQESFRGGPNGGLVNGNLEERFDPGRPQRRVYERRSGTGRGFDMKRDGAGRGNWGNSTDDLVAQETEKGGNLNEKASASEKLEQKEGQATDASKDKGDSSIDAEEKKPEDNEMTLEEYEKVREEKRKALVSMKVEERKVEFDKDFKEMQQLSIKKGNDDFLIKVGSDKDIFRRRENTEKEERAKKAMTINEFLKPSEGERHYSPAGIGRGRGRGSAAGGGGGGGGGGGHYGSNFSASQAAPSIEDPMQFPTLGGK